MKCFVSYNSIFVYKADKSERRGGVGLGLAIARQIVIAHGGSIEVQNHREGGAEIAVYLRVDCLKNIHWGKPKSRVRIIV